MTFNQYTYIRHYATWNAKRFSGKQSATICFDALSSSAILSDDGRVLGIEYMDHGRAEKIANLFRNELNFFYFKKAARRYGKEAVITVSVQSIPHWHFHGQIEIPNHKDFHEVQSFTERFIIEHPWLQPRKNSICYFARTKTDFGTQVYNTRFGSDSLVAF